MKVMPKLEMETETRHHLTQALGIMMSDISQSHWCAGWLYGMEDNLPRDCYRVMGRPIDKDELHFAVSEAEAAPVVLIADMLGHWATWNSDEYLPYVPQWMRPSLAGRD